MELVQSNDLDALADRVAGRLAVVTDPLAALTVIVPDRLLGRHLRLRVAERLGVCAQLQTLSAADLGASMATQVLGPPAIAHTPASARWTVVLSLLNGGAEPAPRLWSRADMVVSALREAERMRPELLRAWGTDSDGTQELAGHWRALYPAADASPAARTLALIDALDRAQFEPVDLIVYSGLGLTATDWRLIAAMDRLRPVLVLLWNPSASYYADGRSERALARLALDPDPLLDHPLLSANGRLPAQTLAMLYGSGWPLVEDDRDEYRRPSSASLLGRIQGDLVDLRRPQRASATLAGPDPNDLSFCLIAAPTELREVETIHELLRKRFEADPTLRPEDVLVVLADFDRYAPLLRAVFKSTAAGDVRHLPLELHLTRGQDQRRQALLALIELGTGTPSAAAIQRLLELEPVHAALGLDAAEVERALAALDSAGFSYGLDATVGGLDFALSRLLLGFALGTDALVREQVAAMPALEGQDARWLDALIVLRDALQVWRCACADSATAAGWRHHWASLVGELLVEASGAAEDQALSAVLDGLELSAPALLVPFPLLAAAWQGALPAPRYGPRLHRGGINVVALRPWQLVPARVVALLGLNDGVVPRSQPPALAGEWFDLTPAQPLDARARDFDRALFLYALQAASEAVLFSCTSSGERGGEQPPSVLYEELLALASLYYSGDPEQVRAQLQIKPPLHAFSLAAYPAAEARDPRLRSIHEHWRPVTERALARRVGAALLTPALSDPEAQKLTGEVDFRALVALARDPFGTYLHRALAVARNRAGTNLPGEARLTLAGQDRSALLCALAQELEQRPLPATPSAALLARGLLPLGPSRLRVYWQARAEVLQVDRLKTRAVEHALEASRVELDDGLYLRVARTRLRGEHLEQVSYRTLDARDQIQAVLDQWLLDLLAPGHTARALGLAAAKAHEPIRSAALIVGRSSATETARGQLAMWSRRWLSLKAQPLWLVPELVARLLARARTDRDGASEPGMAFRQLLLDELKARPVDSPEALVLGGGLWPLQVSTEVLNAMTRECQALLGTAGFPELQRR